MIVALVPPGRHYANPIHCRDVVCDRRDPRHLGVVVSVHHEARVRWTESGWLSDVAIRHLQVVPEGDQ